jgi:hypothetical protein
MLPHTKVAKSISKSTSVFSINVVRFLVGPSLVVASTCTPPKWFDPSSDGKSS